MFSRGKVCRCLVERLQCNAATCFGLAARDEALDEMFGGHTWAQWLYRYYTITKLHV